MEESTRVAFVFSCLILFIFTVNLFQDETDFDRLKNMQYNLVSVGKISLQMETEMIKMIYTAK